MAYDSSLNNRVTGTEEERLKRELEQNNEDIERDEEVKEQKKKILLPKRNLFVQFKAFPNLEQIKTNTVW
jgi:hypothetical protein